MLAWIREKFGAIVIGGIVGLIGFVFVVSGVINPRSTRGLHAGAVAGAVNGQPITLGEFNRELSRRLEFFKNLGGGLSEEQLQAFGLREQVFQELVQRRLLAQAAEKRGTDASDEEVRDRIRQIPAFLKDGRFDPILYKQVLQSNQYTVASFENQIREELLLQSWGRYFRSRVQVSDEELKREFQQTEDKRTLKYAVVSPEMMAAGRSVPDADIQARLKDAANLKVLQSQFETRKKAEFAGKTFDQVKEQLAREAIQSEYLVAAQGEAEKLATVLASEMASDKGSDAKVNAQLKGKGTEVRTASVNRSENSIPSVGDAPELLNAAFQAPQSPIQGKAKAFRSAGGWVVALVTEVKTPDLAKFDQSKGKLRDQVMSRKERALYNTTLKALTAKAKVERNEDVLRGGQADSA